MVEVSRELDFLNVLVYCRYICLALKQRFGFKKRLNDCNVKRVACNHQIKQTGITTHIYVSCQAVTYSGCGYEGSKGGSQVK